MFEQNNANTRKIKDVTNEILKGDMQRNQKRRIVYAALFDVERII